jgi:uncharacterized iron-regulated protein
MISKAVRIGIIMRSLLASTHSQTRKILHQLFLLLYCVFLGSQPIAAMEEATHPHNSQTQKTPHTIEPPETTPAIRLSNTPTMKQIIPELVHNRVIYVGETHTRYDHHLMQLEIIRQLHALYPQLAIGMEFFQQPFQQYLDAYIRGELDEREMLRRTEYYERWRYDYRLYAPILRYAREHGIPLIALNLPVEITQKVGRDGMESLSDKEQAQLPDEIDRSDNNYTQRLKEIYNHHPEGQAPNFEQFLTSQLLWDEGMAQRIVDYLNANPHRRMVVLAGSGHLAYGSGIPNRVARRLPVDSSLIINNWEGALDPTVADILLLPEEQVLPKAGKLGASLDEDKEKGIVKLEACLTDSPCANTGLKKGDQILSIDGAVITSMADLRVMMWDKLPGDEITLSIRRKHWFAPAEELSYQITLQ